MTNVSGPPVPCIEITVGDTTIKVEPAHPRTTTVYNVGGRSPQAVIQRIEEAQRREAAKRRAGRADPTASSSLPVDDASLEVSDRRDEQGQGAPEIAVTVASALLASLNHLLDEGGCDWHVRGDLPLERGAELIGAGRGAAAVAEVDHGSSPSSGCGDTTVGDEGGPGGRIEQPGPRRKILDEYMRVFDAEPCDTDDWDLPLDERAGRAFGVDRRTYNRYAAGLAAALDIPHASASAVLDGLALVAGGAS